MRFSDFLFLSESEGADWGFFGDVLAVLGDGAPNRLSYGSDARFPGDPMLYVPVGGSQIESILKSARRKIAKRGIECRKSPSSFAGYACQQAEKAHKADIMHTGEAHVTVALGRTLEGFFGDAKSTPEKVAKLEGVRLGSGKPLFSNGVGVEMPIRVSQPPRIIYGVAKFFAGQPLVALLEVDCPMISEVRSALGLGPLPRGYQSHVTIGYAYGVDLGDIITTDREKGRPYGSTTTAHDKTYLATVGVKEWVSELI